MNKIYKVVWSKVRNAYVVVSELAKRNSKTKSQHTSRVSHSLLSLAVVSSLALGLVSTVTLPAEAAQRVVAGRYPGTQDNDTMAVGANATATGAGAVSVGTATTNGEDALAVGTDASATGIEAIAIGGATAAYNYAIAMGDGAIAGGTYSVGGVTQSGANAVAIGKSALAYGLNDVVIGANQTAIAPTYTASEDTPDGTGLSSALGGRVMIGHDNIAYGRAGNSVIVGSNNRSNAIHGIAIGQNAYAGQPDGSTLAYENTMSIGTNTRSYSTDAIAIGNNAVAGNTDTSRTSYDGNGLAAAAIGSAAKATSFHTVAIGSTSQATDVSATAIGDAAVASAVSTTAVGNGAQATSIGSLAAGAAATASDQYTIAVGNSAKATALRSMALGYGAVSSGGGAVAIGRTSQATGSYANSLGYENTASGNSSLSVGYHTYAYGTRSIAIGREAVSGTSGSEGNKDTIAIGSTATTQADSAIAIGNAAKTDGAATSSIALGKNAATGIADSVAIGSKSSTTRATDTTSQGWNNQDSTWTGWLSTKGNAGTTSGGVWNSSAGVVSIGTDGFAGNDVTRKLTGLAAGVYDTDAVNMKQWTNTMLATTGDYQVSGSTQYGSDGTPRTATKLLNESLKITGGVDTTLYEQSDFATNPNIGAFISNNTVTLRLNKALTGLTSAAFTDSDGNRTAINGKGVYITPASGSRVTLTTAGLNNGNNRITNVAAGTANTDAVNVSQLNQAIAGVSGGSGTTTTVTVEGGTAAGTSGTYTGNNLQLTSTTGTGTATYDLKLADNVTLGSTGTSGTDGSLTVNGKDGESVAINGSDGTIALTGADGSTATIAAGTAANDVNGNSVNRITAGGQTVATLNDGMVYTGDTGSAAVKLNKTVNIVGGETDSSKLSTDNNIGIVAAQDGDNGKLTVRLAKDITGLNTVEAGDAVLGNQGVVTAGGTAQDGSYVTGLDNTTWNVSNPDIVTGRAATEDQLKTVSDAVVAVTDGTSENATGGFGLTDDSGTAVKQDLGKTIQIAGDGNVTTTADAANGKITVGLSNTIGIGTSGSENGTVTVNGADGSAVAINGADGSISLNTGSGSPITIQAGSSVNDVTGSPVNRITVGGQTVATMNDGMKYGGDFGTVSNVKLNNQVDVKGEATTEADLTTGNIGVVSSQAGDNGLLVVKLNKDIDLGENGSVTTGNTTINNSGLTITNGPSVTSSGINAGGSKITNVATGTDGTDAVNVDQLTKAIAGVSSGEGSKTNLTVEGGTAAGTGGNYTGSNLQITEKTETTGATTYDVKLADNITLGSAADSAAGTEGTDSSITVNGKDGSAVAINGADGSIALNTDDGSPVTIKAGTAANDVNGKSIDRVTVGGATVATLDDGMVYTGDTGSAAVKLNKTVNIVGGETDSSKLSTDNNIGIVAEQDGDNGKLTVRLAKDITGLNTVTAGDATIGTQTETTANGVAQTGSYVTGLDNTEWNVADPDIVTGRAATEDQLKTVSDAVTNAIDGTSENATGGFGLADGSGTTVKQDLGKTITVKGGVTDGTATTDNPTGTSNITTAVKDGALEVSLNKDLDLGSTGSVTTGNTVVNNDGVKVGDTALTSGGLTITNGPSVTTGGIDGGSKQITNVASGSDGVDDDGNPTYNNLTNGANIGDIKNITDAAKTELTNDGLNFTADSGDSVHRNLGETLNIAGDGNITTTSDADNGKITVGLSNTIALGEKASEDGTTEGIDGSITVNGKDGSAVAINGADGSIALNTGSDSPITIQAGSSVNDVTGTPVNRITVGGQTVATMNDGMKYGGDFGTVSNVKLNNQVDVKGEATTEANLTSGNIGVVSSQAGDNGLLVVKLNKDIDLGEKGSVTTGNTVVNNSGLTITNGPSVTTGGIDAGGSKITNVATGTDGTDAVNVAQLEKRISDIAIGESKTTELTVEGGKAAPTDGTYAGSNLQVTASTTANGSPTYDVKLADNITLGSATDSESGTTGTDGSITLNGANGSSVAVNGADGSVTAKGTDGSAVVINGADGSIGLTSPAGADGTQTTVTIAAGDSVNNVDGTPVDRITAGGQTIATMSDGQKYAGDNAKEDGTNVIAKKLNEQLDIVGGAEGELTDKNIGVNNVNGQLKVQLAKNIDLGEKGSVTTGATVINNDGVTITPSTGNPVTLTGTGLNNGGNKITNVASGSDGVDADGNPTYNTTTNAANIGDLKNVNDALVNKGMDFTADSGDTVHRDLGEALGIVGDGQNITTTTDPTNGNITVALSNDISIGKAGTDGVDGKIGVNGKDGSSVVINGADGSIGLTGPAGEDGTQTTVTIAAGDSVNNVDGTPVDRITAGGQTIATMSDGQKYAGDNAKEDGTNVIAKKLNEQLDIVGGADADKLTENNIGVNNVNGQLKVQLAQNIDLGKDGSVTMGNTVVNNSGLTIANGPSVTSSGINAGESKITNVADGDVSATSTDAVNGSQLKAVQDIAEKHTKVTVEGGTEAGTTDYAGNNLQLKATTVDGQTTYDLKLADNLSIGTKGADGKDGVDGSIGVNGKDGSSVVINGTDGISVKGADGKDGVTITGKDGVDGVDGAEGHIGLNGKDGMTDIYTTPGQPGVNGQDGDTMTRIIYTDPNEANHEVATLDDGMKYTGDTGSAAVALNKTVNIVGGETDSTKLSTDNNIGIVAEQADDNAKLTVRLAKDITGLNTVTAGEATIGNQSILTAGGVEQDGSYVTGLDNTSWNVTNPDIVSGRAATEDQLKIVTDTVNALADGTSENATGGFGLTDDSGTAVKQDIGKTIQIAGDGNITTTADATSGKLTVGLSNTIALGEKASEDGTTEGADSSITVNGKDGSSVAINGADGTIALNTADGSPVTIAAGTQVNNLAGTPIDRITIGSATVATLDDGMKYYGDFGDVASVKLNNQVNVKGEANSKDDLTTGNIGVVSAQDGDNALLTVKLNKDINLGSTGSVTTGNTVINNSGVTITPTGGNPVTLTDAGLNNGDNKITNVAPGAINEDSMDAVNGSQLNEIRKLAGQHTYVTVEGGTEGEAAEYAGKNLLLQTRRDNNLTTYYDLKLSDNITLGSANDSEGTGGVDSSITLNGAAGSSVAINGGDGSIALTGANGSTATIAAGTSTPNLAGTAIDRITAGGSTVATLDDGMKYGGDFGDTSKVKLNNQVNVKGNAKNEADLTDGNIGVVSSQDGDNGQLLIKLNKDLNLGDTGSVTMGNTVINNSGVTIGSGTSAVTLTDKGLNNGGNQITNVASGTTGKTYDTSVDGQENYNNAANIGDLTTAINDVKNADNGGGFGLTADDGKSVKQDLGSTITVTGDNNIETKVTDDGKLQVGLKDNVDLGQNGSITAGNTTIDKGGVSTDKIAIKDSGISIDKDGINAGNKQIKDVGSGLGNTYDTSVAGQENYNNGANIGDVYNIAKGQADAVKAQSGKNITVGDDNKVNLNDNITLGDTTDPSKQVNIDGNGATVTAGSGDNQVKLDGSKGQISAGGAVLGNQENTANDGNPATGNYLTGLDNTKWDSNNIQSGRAATEDQLKVVDDKVNKGRVFQGDDGADNSVTVGLGDTLKLNGGADTSKLSSGNIGVVRNSSGDGLDIKLAKDLKDLDSVTTGNTTINDSGVTIKTVDSDRTITIQDSNVNMGNNVVSGVADGTVAPGSTEAINGGQLALRDQAINSLGGEVNKLDNRINRVGAGAAALAALHPQDFDPDDKWDFAFGYGHYRGANAGAFGAFYKPNEDTTFSVGGTIGGGENMINAGVSFKLGQGNNVSNSRVGMAKEIKHLRDDVAKLEDIVNRQSQMINQLTGQNPGTIESKGSELFPDVPANHWAYEYVTKLHQLGIIEGYPDGNFDGNRMMTRYEFAAVVYRAIMAGAASNAALQGDDTLDRLANEFSAELKYIRIDTIAKDKDGKPTIQRVRIVPENKQN